MFIHLRSSTGHIGFSQKVQPLRLRDDDSVPNIVVMRFMSTICFAVNPHLLVDPGIADLPSISVKCLHDIQSSSSEEPHTKFWGSIYTPLFCRMCPGHSRSPGATATTLAASRKMTAPRIPIQPERGMRSNGISPIIPARGCSRSWRDTSVSGSTK